MHQTFNNPPMAGGRIVLCASLALVLSLGMFTSPASAADNVDGNLITFDNDGMWSWYMDERVIVDPTNGKILIGSNSSSPIRYPTTRPTGSVDVFTYDYAMASRSRVQLSDIDEDDHNAPGLTILPDGRYLAMYSNHGNTSMGDYLSRYRISTNPNDSSSWSTETSFNWQTVTGWNTIPNANNRVSYHNLYYLADDDGGNGRLYNFSRATHQSSNALIFNDATDTWSWDGQLTQSSAGGYSTGYIKYASNGVDKIYFMSTETHPRNFNNNLWAGYISDGQTFDIQGNLVDTLGDNEDTGGVGAVPDITEFTNIRLASGNTLADPDANANADGPGIHRLWTVDMSIGDDGNPTAMYIGRNDTGATNPGSTSSPIDHRLFYARWDGTQWNNYELARMGDRLYSSEQDYTGNGALVPGDPNSVYISTQYDPRDPSGATVTTFREIYKGVTDDGGTSWDWSAITSGSNVHNLRPLVPEWDEDHTAVVWFRGTYTSAQSTDSAVVGIIEQNDTETDLVTYVDATTGNTTRSDGSALAATGPSATEGAIDSNWHWRTDTNTGNNNDVLASGGSGSENAPSIKTTLTGLADGLYDIFAFFYANPSQDWRIQAGFSLTTMQLYRDNGAQQAELVQFDGAVTLTGDSSALYKAYIGRAEVTGSSSIAVFLDDFSANTTTRTWYDGLGYALVSDIITFVLGDTDGDLDVDVDDLQNVKDDFGNGGPGALGDGDGDGDCDIDDLVAVKNNYGYSPPGVTVPIPEPATVGLLTIGGLAMLRRRPA